VLAGLAEQAPESASGNKKAGVAKRCVYTFFPKVRALGADSEDAAQASPLAARIAARSGVTTLRESGVEADAFDEIVRIALGRPELRHTPEPPGSRELRDLLERAR